MAENNKDKDTKKEKVKLPADFDIASYAQNYKGHARVVRLAYVADVGEGAEKEALQVGLPDILKQGDVKLYKSWAERLGVSVDQSWCLQTEKEASVLKERLDADLNAAKTSLMKEEIRAAHAAMGDLYYNRNDLNSAFKCYVRTRDYCSSSAHILDMCLKVIVTALEMGNFSHVVNYVSKAEQTPDASAQIGSKLKIATGLAHLHNRKYKSAARSFLDAAPDMGGNSFAEVLSTQDVGLYGAMCGLAQFDRAELKKHIVNNTRFKSFLDATPDLHALVNAFYNCRYTEALRVLEKLRPRLAIDPNLAEHATVLTRQIRNKAIVQFFSPYSAVDMKMMAAAFNTSVPDLEQELKNLIVEGEIAARIDSFNQVLVAKQVDQRTRMFQKATEVGKDHNANMRDMLLRMDLTMQDFSVKVIRRGNAAGQGAGGGAGGMGGMMMMGGGGMGGMGGGGRKGF